MSSPLKTALIIGGTGAQGSAVVRALSSTSHWAVRILTRNPSSKSATSLAALPNVSLIEGNPLSEATLVSALHNTSLAFINTNGFAIGEKAEVYWGIRIYELCASAHVQHFIYATIDYASALGHFDPAYRCAHADGKSKVAQFIAAQPLSTMSWSILHSGPYMETLSEMLKPSFDKEADTWVFSAPLGDGYLPLIALEDLGWYAAWIAEHPSLSAGMWLKVSTADVSWPSLVEAFTKVTGKKAVYKDVSLEDYFASGVFPNPEAKVGHGVGPDDETLQTYRQNFSGFWNMWKGGLAKRDYAVLDEIYPERVRSVEEWIKNTGYTGEAGTVLKDYEDRKGKSPSAGGVKK